TPADLDADLAASMALCEVRGSAIVDGAPAPHLALLCGDPAPDGTVAVRHVRDLAADRQGQFRSGALPAGSYALHLRLVCAGRTIAVPVSEWRRAAPGQCLWFEPVAITTTALQLVLRDAAGTAIG